MPEFHNSGFFYTLSFLTNQEIKALSNIELNFAMPDSTTIEFTGLIGADTVAIRLRNKPLDGTRLLGRGFHWSTEYPYNR